MSFDKKSLSVDSDEDSMPDDSYLTSVLSIVNGFCKVNLEVQQKNTFYSEDSLLPINAKINNNIHCMQQKSMNTNILINDKRVENIWESNSLNSNDEFEIYSKPSYSASILNKDKKPNLIPKPKRKTTFNMFDTELSRLDSLHTIQNVFKDYNIGQDDNEALEIGLQKQEFQNKRMTKNFNNLSFLEQSTSGTNKIPIQNEDSLKYSECPLCFKLYRSEDIEAHASGCST